MVFGLQRLTAAEEVVVVVPDQTSDGLGVEPVQIAGKRDPGEQATVADSVEV